MLHHHLHSPTSTATQNHPTSHDMFYDELDMDSNCSTPYVSAPSSPGRNAPPLPIPGFYYSAPSSPMHFIVSTAAVAAAAAISRNTSISPHSEASPASSTCSFEFDFSTRLTTTTTIGNSQPGPTITMTSADELFFNGQIRPMNVIDDAPAPAPAPFPFDGDVIDVTNEKRGRAAKYRDRSRRRTRSMSPERTMVFDWQDDFETEKNDEKMDSEEKDNNGIEGNECEELDPTTTTNPIHTTESGSSSSRSSSVGRGSKRWVFLKEFLNRSKSEGRNNGNKFWGSLSFSPVKDKIKIEKSLASSNVSSSKEKIDAASEADAESGKEVKKKKTVNGVEKRRRMPPSAHELHYTANRAQAEEMRKKTFLPYRHGLLGCLGFSSKSYGAMNGFATTFNPLSST